MFTIFVKIIIHSYISIFKEYWINFLGSHNAQILILL